MNFQILDFLASEKTSVNSVAPIPFRLSLTDKHENRFNCLELDPNPIEV